MDRSGTNSSDLKNVNFNTYFLHFLTKKYKNENKSPKNFYLTSMLWLKTKSEQLAPII